MAINNCPKSRLIKFKSIRTFAITEIADTEMVIDKNAANKYLEPESVNRLSGIVKLKKNRLINETSNAVDAILIAFWE
jgi:hypothetical protein